MEITFTLKTMSPLLSPATLFLCVVTMSSSSQIIIRLVSMTAVIPVVLDLVDISESPCISIVGRKLHGLHPQVILILLPSNTLVRFSSTVPSESNGVTTNPFAVMLVSRYRRPASPGKVVLILKVLCILLSMGKLMVETGGYSLITTSFPYW